MLEPRGDLVRVVTRTALDRLRTASCRREEYVGEWLPEPLLTNLIAEEMPTVLGTLGPTERAVFVLPGVFELPYGEIAEAVGRSAATVRQIARQARKHEGARRPRVQVSESSALISALGRSTALSAACDEGAQTSA